MERAGMNEAKEMEGDELKKFIRLCVLTTASLLYTYFIAAKIPKGFPRLISLLPVIILLLILPFDLNSFFIGFQTCGFLSWFANFKLLLFAFDQGPLSSVPKRDLLRFILTACFPFKIKQNPPVGAKSTNPALEAVTRATILWIVLYTCNNYEHYFHKYLLWLWIYYFAGYHLPRLIFAVAATPAQFLLGAEIEPQFGAPLFSTSLQDFWGRRWNIRASEILRDTVYNPVRRISTRIIGPRWASLPSVFVTFLVSGFMHELLVYYITRARPTWKMTWFFILQGVFVDVEIVMKKKLVATNKFRLHRAISRPLTLANIAITVYYLSYTLFGRNGIDKKVLIEFNMLMEFLKGIAQ